MTRRLFRIPGQSCFRNLNSIGLQQFHGFCFEEVGPPFSGGRPKDCLCSLTPTRGSLGRLWSRHCPLVMGILYEGRETLSRPFGRVEDGYPMGFENLERADRFSGKTGLNEEGLFVRFNQRCQLTSCLLLQFSHMGRDDISETSEKTGHQEGIDVVILHADAAALRDHVRVLFGRTAVVYRIVGCHPFD